MDMSFVNSASSIDLNDGVSWIKDNHPNLVFHTEVEMPNGSRVFIPDNQTLPDGATVIQVYGRGEVVPGSHTRADRGSEYTGHGKEVHQTVFWEVHTHDTVASDNPSTSLPTRTESNTVDYLDSDA